MMLTLGERPCESNILYKFETLVHQICLLPEDSSNRECQLRLHNSLLSIVPFVKAEATHQGTSKHKRYSLPDQIESLESHLGVEVLNQFFNDINILNV